MEPCTSKILKIITVDDSSIVTERLKYILNEIENVVLLGNANTISSAKSLISTVNPDIIILDINLPEDNYGQTGLGFLAELRKKLPKTKIIVFTNHNELHYRLICLEKGATCFFDKSNGPNKILETIKKWSIKN